MWNSLKSVFTTVAPGADGAAQQQQQHSDPTQQDSATTTATTTVRDDDSQQQQHQEEQSTTTCNIIPLGLAALYSSSTSSEVDIRQIAFKPQQSDEEKYEGPSQFTSKKQFKKISFERVSTIESAHQEERIWHVDWHPNGQMFATCGADRTVRIWRRKAKNESSLNNAKNDDNKNNNENTSASFFQACEAVEHSRTVRRVAWSPCGKYLAAASFDGSTSVWRLFEIPPTTAGENNNNNNSDNIRYSLLQLELETMLEGHENEVKSCAWDPIEGQFLATCSRDRSVWVWEKLGGDDEEQQHEVDEDGSNNNKNEDTELPIDFDCAAVLGGHSQDVKNVIFAPTLLRHSSHFNNADSSFELVNPKYLDIVSSSYDDTTKIWRNFANTTNDDEWHCVQTLTKHTGTVWESRFQPQGIFSSAIRNQTDDANSNASAESGSFSKISCVSDVNAFPALASCSDDGTVALFRLTLPPQLDELIKRLPKSQKTNIARFSKFEHVGSIGHFHEAGSSVISFDWLPPLPVVSTSSSNSALLSRSSLLLSCATDDNLCLVECPILRHPVSTDKSEGDAALGTSSSSLFCIDQISSPHSLEMNCVRIASQWESVEFHDDEKEKDSNAEEDDSRSREREDTNNWTQHRRVKKASVLVVTVGDDGNIVVSRLTLEMN